MLVSEAAKLLGMNTQTLRLALQQKLFPFGVAVKTSDNRYTYYINDQLLLNYVKGGSHEEVLCDYQYAGNSNSVSRV